jgi:hypothetical protein
MNRIENDINGLNNDIIYHYCSLDTFMAIMENKTLRLTNIVKSNDASEISFALRLISMATEETLFNWKKGHSEDSVVIELLDNFSIDRFFGTLISEANLTYYATCFSRESDLLSQWRGYASDGNGIAIGFYEPLFKQFISKDVSMKYAHVSYDEKKLSSRVASFIEERFKKISSMTISHLSDYESALSELLTWSIYQAVFFKNPAFSEERESRLVFYPFGNIRNLRDELSLNAYKYTRYFDRMSEHFDYYGTGNRHGEFTLSSPSFMIRKNRIVSYMDISFASVSNDFLIKLILGPKTDMNDLDLRLYLHSKGYDIHRIRVEKSKIPYIS